MSAIEVAIGPSTAPGTFRVEVVDSPAGEASAVVQLDVDALQARRGELQQALLASGVAVRRVLPETERPVREVGQLLFNALLGNGDVAGRYRASAAIAETKGHGLRVVLRIDTPALAGLPWEAMYDEATSEYVCQQDQMVRHVPVASVPAPLSVNPPLRILGVASSPRRLHALDVDKEKDLLRQALAHPISNGRVQVEWTPTANWADIHDMLLDGPWHVLHFIGHGDFDPGSDEGVLALTRDDGQADLVAAHRFAGLLRQAQPMPRLVLLNSCSGATTGVTDLFTSTAATLVRGGVSAVIAMQYAISDIAAVSFSRGFYSAIARGRGVDDAVSSGRVAILGSSGQTLEWVTPVLYLRGHETQLYSLPQIAGRPASDQTESRRQGTGDPSECVENRTHDARVGQTATALEPTKERKDELLSGERLPASAAAQIMSATGFKEEPQGESATQVVKKFAGIGKKRQGATEAASEQIGSPLTNANWRRNVIIGAIVGIVGSLLIALIIASNVLGTRSTVGSVRWTYATGGPITSAPMVANGLIYVGSTDGKVYSLDAATGHVRWKKATGSAIYSGLTVAAGMVFVGNSNGTLYALDAATGHVRWTYSTAGPIEASPAEAGNTVYVGSRDDRVYALDAASGRVRWSHATGDAIYSASAVVDGTVYVGSLDGRVYALEATTGHVRWTRATEGSVYSGPTVASGTVYVGSTDKYLYALNAASGRVRWTQATGGAISSRPAIAGSTVYVGSHDGRLYALEAATGMVRWSHNTGGLIEAGAIVANGTVYFGSSDDNLYALNTTSGVVRWSYATGGSIQSAPAVSGDTVYVASSDGRVYALYASGS